MPECSRDREWCRGLTAISTLLSLLVLIMGILSVSQERRMAHLEGKNDTIVELKTDMRYVMNDIAEIKQMLRKQQQ